MSEDLEQIKDAVMATGAFRSIILFGSRATGDQRTGSDYDLLLIASEEMDRSRRMEHARLLRTRLASMGYDVDLLIRTPAEVEKGRHTVNTVTSAALKQGIRLC